MKAAWPKRLFEVRDVKEAEMLPDAWIGTGTLWAPEKVGGPVPYLHFVLPIPVLLIGIRTYARRIERRWCLPSFLLEPFNGWPRVAGFKTWFRLAFAWWSLKVVWSIHLGAYGPATADGRCPKRRFCG